MLLLSGVSMLEHNSLIQIKKKVRHKRINETRPFDGTSEQSRLRTISFTVTGVLHFCDQGKTPKYSAKYKHCKGGNANCMFDRSEVVSALTSYAI